MTTTPTIQNPGPSQTRTQGQAQAAAMLLEVSVVWGAREVVSHVRLEFPRGQVTCLVGPGGSGKSTVLGLLDALAAPPPVDGAATKELALSWRGLGMSRVASCAYFRQHGLHSPRAIGSLLAELDLDLADLGLPLADMGIDSLEALGRRALRDVADPLRRLLSFALIARSGREMLLIDEPLFALPEAMAAWVRAELHALARRGQTMVVVTHNVALARALADHVALLVDGELIEAGEAEAFFHHTRHPRTRQYLRWGG